MTNSPSDSAVAGVSAWWHDRQFTKREGRISAAVFSAIGVFLTFSLCVLFSS